MLRTEISRLEQYFLANGIADEKKLATRNSATSSVSIVVRVQTCFYKRQKCRASQAYGMCPQNKPAGKRTNFVVEEAEIPLVQRIHVDFAGPFMRSGGSGGLFQMVRGDTHDYDLCGENHSNVTSSFHLMRASSIYSQGV